MDGETVKLDGESKTLFKVSTSLDAPVKDFKDTLKDTLNISQENQELSFDGKVLVEGDFTLKEYKIEHKSAILVKDTETSIVRAVSVKEVGREPTHAMVVIGVMDKTKKRKNKKGHPRLYILWNSWPEMPLVAVSIEYLIACQCKVHFVACPLSPGLFDGFKTTGTLACDCAPLDHAEDTLAFEPAGYDG